MNYKSIAGAQLVRFEKNDLIVEAGEMADYFYIIERGTCHRIRVSDKGDETILYTYHSSDIICAFIAYYHIVSASNIVADSTVYCYKIPRNAFMEQLNTDISLMRMMMEQIMSEHFNLLKTFHGKREGRTPGLLCNFILNHSTPLPDGTRLLEKSYTNVKLAQILGVHKVTATRIINKLQQLNVLSRTEQGMVILDPNELEAYASYDKTLKYG